MHWSTYIIKILFIESKPINLYKFSLKPENIVIDEEGYIKLTDFGLAECNVNESTLVNDFCGTPEYLAPEFFSETCYGKEIDFWSLGVLLYEMVCGQLPFIEKNREKLFQAIKHPKIYYPSDISIELIDFFQKIFEVNPKKRLGSKGAIELKTHPFFMNVNWEQLILKKLKSPLKPSIHKKNSISII